MKRLAGLFCLLSVAAWGDDTLPPLASYTDLISRPLFSPTRRPSATATSAALSSSAIRLSGLVTERGKMVALIHLADQNKDLRVGPGASLNGWHILSIDAAGLDLQGGGRQLRVGLKQGIPPPPE